MKTSSVIATVASARTLSTAWKGCAPVGGCVCEADAQGQRTIPPLRCGCENLSTAAGPRLRPRVPDRDQMPEVQAMCDYLDDFDDVHGPGRPWDIPALPTLPPERPWETTPLPEPVTHFDCPGDSWHDDPRAYPGDMTWVQGVPGTCCPKDDFYCRSCIYQLTEFEEVPVVTGPTLAEELARRESPDPTAW